MAQLSHLEFASMMLAAFCHDFDHPGVNNQYLVASSDLLALDYNDKSILENHHIAEVFKLLH